MFIGSIVLLVFFTLSATLLSLSLLCVLITEKDTWKFLNYDN